MMRLVTFAGDVARHNLQCRSRRQGKRPPPRLQIPDSSTSFFPKLQFANCPFFFSQGWAAISRRLIVVTQKQLEDACTMANARTPPCPTHLATENCGQISRRTGSLCHSLPPERRRRFGQMGEVRLVYEGPKGPMKFESGGTG